ncbi:hypothetical protein BC332_03850 [Capsicum chinense]|nr:hypothetical protein BC332_03850 [Capsicum chinense]
MKGYTNSINLPAVSITVYKWLIPLCMRCQYEMSTTDAFERTTSTFRNIISRDPGSCFPVESGRYHLYISYVFPWASRCLAYLKIKGIDQAIDFTSVKPIWERTKGTDEHMGWVFSSSSIEEPGADPDPVNGAKT